MTTKQYNNASAFVAPSASASVAHSASAFVAPSASASVAYDIKIIDGSKLLVTKKSLAALRTRHDAKKWDQLTTADKLSLIALHLNLIDEEGNILCLNNNNSE